MRFRYLDSFDRSVRGLSREKRAKVAQALSAFLDFYETGLRPEGLGLKKLGKGYWELRAGLDTRIIFTLEKGLATFILAGTHDDLRRFLRRG